jgi:thiol:disulfide interchange protein
VINIRRFFKGPIGTIVLFAAIGLAVYFVNVEVQTYFGHRAVENTGLVSTQFDAALAKASAENKLVFVDVSAIWCSTCRALDNNVFSDDEVRKVINERFIFSRIEYESDEGQAFLERYATSGFPTLWLIDSDGTIVDRLKVTMDPKEFVAQLAAYKGKVGT